MFFCRFGMLPLPCLHNLDSSQVPFFFVYRLKLIRTLFNLIWFTLLSSLFCCFWLVLCLLKFVCKSVVCMYLRWLVFVFFEVFACFAASCLHIYMHIPPRTPCYTQIPNEFSYPNTIPIVATSLLDFTVCMLPKTTPSRPFGPLFSLFLVPSLPMGLYAPIQTTLYPFAPIHITFWQTPQNMMSGEISPAITPKSWSETLAIPPSCLVFVLPMHYGSQRTHVHPSPPIWTWLYPFIPLITCVYGVI